MANLVHPVPDGRDTSYHFVTKHKRIRRNPVAQIK